jgi:ricin-type beta-trefoil lectin protein
VWRRADRTTVWIVGLLAVMAVVTLVRTPSERVAGLTVPVQNTDELLPPTVTAVGVGNTATSAEPSSPVAPPSTTSWPATLPPAKTSAARTMPTKAKTNPVPATPRFDSAASFRIVNVVNGLTLDSGGWVKPRTPMKLWAPSPSTNLQFQLLETDSGYYRLVNRTNGLVVDGRGATDEGAYVGQWPSWDYSPNLQWLPAEVSGGMFTLTNRATGLVLDGGGRGVQFGSPAKQWRPDNSPNLLWRIMKV